MLKKIGFLPQGHLFVISFCMILILLHPIPPLIAADINLYKRTWKLLDTFLNRYKGSSFNKVISLGDRKQFYNALMGSVIKIDTAYCKKKDIYGVAEYNPFKGRKLTLKYDPSKVPVAEREETFITIWHETVHLIEYSKGDKKGDVDWKERHAEFLEVMVKNVFDPLMKLEKQANNQHVSDRDLQSKWATIVRGFEQGAKKKNSRYPHPPNIAQFEKWFGARIRLSEIENHYRSGAGGPRMKRIVESVLLESIKLNSLQIKAYPRRLDDSHTTYDLTFGFKINGRYGWGKWKGNIDWTAHILDPKKKWRGLKGSFPNLVPGYRMGSTRFYLPDTSPEGKYFLVATISTQGLKSKKSIYFTLKYPPVKFNIIGPKEVEDGDTCKATVTITSGVPPFKWEWSGGGANGKGSATAFDMVVRKAPKTSIIYTVKVWDKIRSANPKKGPVIKTFTVKVKKKPPDLKISIKYPKESAVGRVIDIIPTVTGGKRKYRYEWTVISGRVVTKRNLRGKLRSPGNKTINLRVWDDGRYKKTPKKTSITIKVYPKLEGHILAPKEANDGEQVTVKAILNGGKKSYKLQWTNPIGRTLTKETLKGTVRGKPGEKKHIKLRVEDSLTPPQIIEISAVIKVKQYNNISGTWRWKAKCGTSTFTGSFAIGALSRDKRFSGSFSGTHYGTITTGKLNGNQVTFIRKFGDRTQRWTGTLLGNKINGTLTDVKHSSIKLPTSCRFVAIHSGSK